MMTPAASISFFRPEFDDFLYAAIYTDKDGMPLSVLSALARMNVDPWEEAAIRAAEGSSYAEIGFFDSAIALAAPSRHLGRAPANSAASIGWHKSSGYLMFADSGDGGQWFRFIADSVLVIAGSGSRGRLHGLTRRRRRLSGRR
jgi:hypothetical protein